MEQVSMAPVQAQFGVCIVLVQWCCLVQLKDLRRLILSLNENVLISYAVHRESYLKKVRFAVYSHKFHVPA
jgi:hypothetical protein